jgi:hypothetical protein
MQILSLTAPTLLDLVPLSDCLHADVNIVYAQFNVNIAVVVRSVHIGIQPIQIHHHKLHCSFVVEIGVAHRDLPRHFIDAKM